MDLLKCFSLNDKEYTINIQGTHEEPLFQANQIGKLLGMTNIRVILKNFDDDEKVVNKVYTLGGKQNTTFLNEHGLYRLIGRSNLPIAKKFQKWTCQIIKEIRLNGSYKLQESNEIDKKLIEYQYALKNHKTFLQAYDNKNVIYLYKLNEIDDKLVIKIIKKYNHPIEMKNKKLSTETYLVNQEELDEILKIIDMNKNQFENKDNILVEEIRLKTEETRKINETLSLGLEIVSLEKEKIILKQKELGNYVSIIVQEPIIEVESTVDSNITTCNYMIKERKYGKRVPKIYQY